MINKKRKYKFLKKCLTVLPLLGLLLTGNTVSAANGSDFKPGRIIEDAVFTNKDSMSQAGIQDFLQSKGSVCLTSYSSPEPLGNDNYGSNVLASQVIYKSAQIYSISPRVLLATLQKETGLITTSDCSSWRYRTAMGFACPDNGTCDPDFFGFSKQMYQAARHFKNYFDNNPNWFIPYAPGVRRVYYHPNQGCGYTDLNIENRATAALYSYTPYQPNQGSLNNLYGLGDACSSYGNRNFWREFVDWKFNITRAVADNAAATGDYRQWLVDDVTGTRQYIPSADVINAWNLDSGMVLTPMSSSVLGSYRTVERPLSKVIRTEGSLEVHYVYGGKKFPVASGAVLSQWGFSGNDVADVTKGIGGLLTQNPKLSTYIDGSQNQWLLDFSVGTKYYLTQDAGTSWALSTDPGLENPRAPKTEFSDTVFGLMSQGPNLNRIIRASGTVPIYFVDSGTRHRALSPGMLGAWGYGNSSVTDLSQEVVNILNDGQDLTYAVKNPGNQNVYMADGSNGSGKVVLRPYEGPDVFMAWEGALNTFNVSQYYFTNSMVVSADPLSTSKITYGGQEYQAVSGQRLPMSITAAGLYPGTAESISEATYNRLMPSAPVRHFIQQTGSVDIFMVDGLTRHRVANPEVLRAWGIGANPPVNMVNGGYLNLIPEGSLLNTFEADLSGQLYLMDGRKITVPSNLDTGYRTSGNIYTPTQNLLDLLPQGETASSFLKGFQTQPIYLMDGGTIRHIRTPEDLSLWNNGETVTSVSQYILKQFSQSGFVGHYVTNGSTNYVVSGGNKYTVSASVATKWGLTSPESLVHATTISRYAGSSALTSLIKGSGDPIYLVDQGLKKHILSPSIFSDWSFNSGEVLTVSDVLINSLSSGTSINVLAKSPTAPEVYKIESGQKRHVLSVDAMARLGYDYSSVSVVSQALLDTYPTGSPIP